MSDCQSFTRPLCPDRGAGRTIFSPDISWPLGLRWDWWKSSSEQWQAPGSIGKQPPEAHNHKPAQQRKISSPLESHESIAVYSREKEGCR